VGIDRGHFATGGKKVAFIPTKTGSVGGALRATAFKKWYNEEV
jgi:hypothetical protein